MTLVPYSEQPCDNNDELTLAQGNDTRAIRRTAFYCKGVVTQAKDNDDAIRRTAI